MSYEKLKSFLEELENEIREKQDLFDELQGILENNDNDKLSDDSDTEYLTLLDILTDYDGMERYSPVALKIGEKEIKVNKSNDLFIKILTNFSDKLSYEKLKNNNIRVSKIPLTFKHEEKFHDFYVDTCLSNMSKITKLLKLSRFLQLDDNCIQIKLSKRRRKIKKTN